MTGVPPTRTPPRISVLMALYGRADLADAALRSLAASMPVPYEVIVVDNASPDGAGARLAAALPEHRVITSALNLGFGAAIDLAALHARGELLLVLNSDIVTEPGWLQPLLDLLDARPSVAAVTPTLVVPGDDEHADELEVGSALFGDAGTAVLTHEGAWEPHRPRPVPYASAACLLIRRSAFNAVGGFDAIYARGYYEDVDLAIELRARGMAVYCHPPSRVRHLRGGSSAGTRATDLMLFNRTIFRQRHAATLAALPPAAPASGFRRRDSVTADRLLVIDDRVPNSDRGSGDPRMAALLGRIAVRFPDAAVTLLGAAPTTANGGYRYGEALAVRGVEIADWSASTPADWLRCRRGHFSAVLVSRHTNVARFRALIEATQPQAIRAVDVEAVVGVRLLRHADLLRRSGDPGWSALERRANDVLGSEVSGWRWAEVITCVSQEEAELVRRSAPGTPVIVVAGLAAAPPTEVPRAGRRGLVYFGGFMSGEDAPNADAVRHLADELLPTLWHTHPELAADLGLDVLGADPTPSVRASGTSRIAIVGRVDDPVAALSRYVVNLAPQRFGSGIKLKFLDAMAAGTPFVTTPIGAEGLHLDDLADVLVGATTAELVARTARLITDETLWSSVHDQLRELARTHFGTAAFDRSIDRALAHFGAVAA